MHGRGDRLHSFPCGAFSLTGCSGWEWKWSSLPSRALCGCATAAWSARRIFGCFRSTAPVASSSSACTPAWCGEGCLLPCAPWCRPPPSSRGSTGPVRSSAVPWAIAHGGTGAASRCAVTCASTMPRTGTPRRSCSSSCSVRCASSIARAGPPSAARVAARSRLPDQAQVGPPRRLLRRRTGVARFGG